MLDQQQLGVLRGIIAGLAVTVVGLVGGALLVPAAVIADPDVAGRMAFSLTADVPILAWLAFCIGILARHRFFSAEDIDGSALSSGTERAHILQANLQNTLEQTVLAIGTHLAWAIVMPINWAGVIPAAVLLFLVGRALFLRGYAGGAPARAFGFALTFYPSVGMLLATMAAILLG